MKLFFRCITILVLFLCVTETWAVEVFSINVNTDELVRIDVVTGEVTVVGKLNYNASQIDLAVAAGKLFGVNAYSQKVDLLEIDMDSGEVISSTSVTCDGKPIKAAKGLAEIDGQLKIGFNKNYTASNMIGTLAPDGTISDIKTFANADFDGLGANKDGELYSLNAYTVNSFIGFHTVITYYTSFNKIVFSPDKSINIYPNYSGTFNDIVCFDSDFFYISGNNSIYKYSDNINLGHIYLSHNGKYLGIALVPAPESSEPAINILYLNSNYNEYKNRKHVADTLDYYQNGHVFNVDYVAKQKAGDLAEYLNNKPENYYSQIWFDTTTTSTTLLNEDDFDALNRWAKDHPEFVLDSTFGRRRGSAKNITSAGAALTVNEAMALEDAGGGIFIGTYYGGYTNMANRILENFGFDSLFEDSNSIKEIYFSGNISEIPETVGDDFFIYHSKGTNAAEVPSGKHILNENGGNRTVELYPVMYSRTTGGTAFPHIAASFYIGQDLNDPDNDGLSNYLEAYHQTGPEKADTDEDGLPDGWETVHHLNPLKNDAWLDQDIDGYPNIEEYRAETAPDNTDSLPDISEGFTRNLALYGTASQCSTYYKDFAGAANDGITDGNYKNSRGCHTNSEGNPWWRVDLENVYALDRIVIWNRTDTASARLTNFKVMVFDENMQISYSEDFYKDGGTFSPDLMIELPENIKGKYVQVQLNGSNYLHIAEVQVFGDPTPVPEDERSSLVNLALNGETSQSSDYATSGKSEKSADGNLDGSWPRRDISITNDEGNAWWQLDLKDVYSLDKIVLWRRTDNGWNNFDKLRIFIFDENMNILHFERTDFSDKVYPIYKIFDLPENIKGRYIKVQSDRSLSVQLAEVQVFGNPTPVPEDERSPLVNLALNGETSQSSDYATSGKSEKSADGNLDGSWPRRDISITNDEGNAWWQLDLKDVYSLDKIILWRRTDNGWNNFDKLRIFIFDENMNILHVETTDFSDKVYPIYKIFDLPENIKGRYIKVQSDRSLSVQLAEVQVFGNPTPVPENERSPLVNLALNGTASQSSNYSNRCEAIKAMDGSLDGNYYRDAISATKKEGNAWWQTDLNDSYNLNKIVLWRITYGNWNFFNNLKLIIFDDKMQIIYTEDISFSDGIYPIYKIVDLPEDIKGRYVRVQLNGINYLELAEVQVFGNPTPVSEDERSPFVNLALNKSATQSSIYNRNTSAENAVNGSLDGNWNRNSVSSSKSEKNPWLRIDLGAVYNINRIMIWRRTDAGWNYLNNFKVSVLDETMYPVYSRKISVTDNNFPIYYDIDLTDNSKKRNKRDGISSDIIINTDDTADPGDAVETGDIVINPGDIVIPDENLIPLGITGRYVQIQMDGTASLQLAEVQVFGYPDPLEMDTSDPRDMEPTFVPAVTEGKWSDPATWGADGRIPGPGDWIYIGDGQNIIADIPVDLGSGGIYNEGTITSADNKGEKLTIRAASIYNSGDIIGQNGQNKADMALEACPSHRIRNGYCWDGSRWNPLATKIYAAEGGDVEIYANRFYNDVKGKVQAGNGGNDDFLHNYMWKDPYGARSAKGGNVLISTLTTINEGIIQSGNGGDAEGVHAYSRGGNGGDILVMTDITDPENESKNTGFFSSGEGGDARTQAGYGRAGKGGDIIVFMPDLQCNAKTPDTGCIKGHNGSVFAWDPVQLKAHSGLSITGFDDILIYTDNNGDVDLSELGEGAIKAAKSIIISAGEGGTVNLEGLSGKVFEAGEKVEVYADKILVDEGISLENLVDSPQIIVEPGKLMRRVSLSAEEDIQGEAGSTINISFRVLNIGPDTDTYTFVVKNSENQELATLPSETVKSRELNDLNVNITLPEDADDLFVFTVEAVSENDSSANAVIEMQAHILHSEQDSSDPDNDSLPNYLETESGTDPQKADTDEDGIFDGWEVAYDLNPLEDDAADDPDNDGFSNIKEYKADTDPNDTESFPEVTQDFSAGVFTVIAKDGKIKVDYIFDGGAYEGEMGIFSLTGMDAFDLPGSERFIAEAVRRVLSDSSLGYIVIRDKSEGARLDGPLGNGQNENDGYYKGLRSFDMTPGDRFAAVLIPDGTFEEVAKNPEIIDNKKKCPLFSLATANPDDGLYYGQIAGIPVEGKDNSLINAIAFEDMSADNSDRDYNDLIVQFRGVSVKSPTLDAVINPEKEWRTGGDGVSEHLNVPQPDANTLWMTVTLKSPADILVYAPDGTFIGKDGGTIPGATFEWDENGHQVITLPALDEGEYRVVLRAIDEGGLCHLEVKGYKGDEELAVKEIPVTIEPHQVLETTLPADEFVDSHTVTFETPEIPKAADGTALPYDFDGDGDIDDADIERVSGKWGVCSDDPEYDFFYDMDGDGCIGFVDIMSVANVYHVQ